MKDPAFLFYSSDFLTGTALLTHEEVGKYIRLLCYMHQHGELTKEQMEVLVGNLSVNLMVKFSLTETQTYTQPRLFEEIEKRKRFTESRRNNGKKGGRKPIGKANAKPLGKAKNNLPENENENRNNNINRELEYPFVSENFLKVWNVLTSQPKWKKKTLAALQGNLNLLSGLSEVEAITTIQATINGGWQGLFPKETKTAKKIDELNKFINS